MDSQRDGATPPDFLTVEEAARVVRIGRTSAYELARRYLDTDGAEGLPVVRFGRQLRVPRCRLEETLGGPISWPVARPDPVDTETAAPPVVLTARRRQSSIERDESSSRLFSV
jgi:hypothetical protein